MFSSRLKAVFAASAASFALALTVPPATAETPAPAPASASLASVPAFFIAGPDGQPYIAPGDTSPVWYLSHTQASLNLGVMRGYTPRGRKAPDLDVALTNLADVAAKPGPHAFARPSTLVEVASSVEGAPVYLVRDAGGAPFTVRRNGVREVPFFISEIEAHDFLTDVVKQTGSPEDSIRLSVISLGVVLEAMRNPDDPAVLGWAIRASDEMRRDAEILREEARLTGLLRFQE